MKNIKKPLYSALVFFGTLIVLSVGYAAYTSMSQVQSGDPLTKTIWNQMVDNLTDLNSRAWQLNGANSYYTAGKVGIGTTSPSSPLHVFANNNGAKILLSNDTTHGYSLGYDTNGGYIQMISTDRFTIYDHDGAGFLTMKDGGNVGIGTTSPTYKLDVRGIGVNGGGIATGLVLAHIGSMAADGAGIEFTYGNAGGGGSANIARIAGYTQSGGGGDILFQTAPSATSAYATKMKVQRDGNAWLAGTLTQASDTRLKKNIKSINSGISTVDKLRGVTYNRKDETKDNNIQYGFIAQEVEKILPNLVKTDDTGYKAINYTGIIPVLVRSIQEQQKQIEELKKEVKELKL